MREEFPRSLTPSRSTPPFLKFLGIIWVILTSGYFLFTLSYPYVTGKTYTFPFWGTNSITLPWSNAPSSSGAFRDAIQQGSQQELINLKQALEAQFASGCTYIISFPIGWGKALGIVNAACVMQSLQGSGFTMGTGSQTPGVKSNTKTGTAPEPSREGNIREVKPLFI
jgi:hypothetical protein